MNSERQIKIDADLTGRIDKVLGHFLSDVSRSQLQKWIEDGHVTVMTAKNHCRPSNMLQAAPVLCRLSRSSSPGMNVRLLFNGILLVTQCLTI